MRSWLVAGVLLALGSTQAEVRLDDDRLTLDGWVRGNAHYWFITNPDQTTGTEFVYEPVQGGAGLGYRPVERASMRASVGFSTGGVWLEDACVRFDWPGGWNVTAGQFLLPLSLEALMLPQDYPPAFNGTMLAGFIKPNGGRDVGVMGGYRGAQLDAAVCVVNGLGQNAWAGENKYRKDLCGRIMAQPWCGGPWLGGRIYRALEMGGQAWLTWGAEATYATGPMRFAAEFQNHISRYAHNNAAYAQGLYTLGRFEPGLRLEMLLPSHQLPEVNATAGATFRPFDAPVKLAAHYSLHGSLEGRWWVGEVLLRVQAEL